MSSKLFPWGRNAPRKVSLRRDYREEEYEGYSFRYEWKLRGNKDMAYGMVVDRDWPYMRARHPLGWKNGKGRRQWEHNVIEREKHDRNRRNRANRAGDPVEYHLTKNPQVE